MADLPSSTPAAPAVDGATHLHSGKVRDLYRIDAGEHAGRLLMVASDRISAFDFILDTPVPDKGEILTAMSLWWFERLADLVPNHLVSLDVPASVAGRAVVCESLSMYPVECVARGYLAGSGLVDYHRSGEVCGIALPAGLQDGSRLPEPIFTPASKAAFGDHDENVDYAAVVATVGDDVAAVLRRLTLQVYARAEETARARGIVRRRHEGRVRPPRGRHDRAGRRGAHPRLVPLLAGCGVGARPRAGVVRQADRPGLAAVAGLRLGPGVGGAPAAAARRGRGAHPGPLRRGLRAAHRRDLPTPGTGPVTREEFSATVDMPHAPKVAFTYLVDPRNRPEWQASLLSVRLDERDAEPAVGLTWRDTLVVGVKPRMEITELVPYRVFTEAGHWGGIAMQLTLRFVATGKGCRIHAEGRLEGAGSLVGGRARRRVRGVPLDQERPGAGLAGAVRPRPR